MQQKRVQWPVLVAVVMAVVTIDQAAKSWSGAAGSATFGHVRNTGLLLGVLAAPAPVLILWMAFVMTIFLVVIARWAVQLGVSAVIPALITGGFLAHMLDRARYGAVRDFIHTPSGLVLDFADIAVVVGIVALVVAVVGRIGALHASSSHVTFDVRTMSAVVISDDAR